VSAVQLFGQRFELRLGRERRVGVVGGAHPLGDRRGEVIGQLVAHGADLVGSQKNKLFLRVWPFDNALCPIHAVVRGQLVARFGVLLPHLNERQQRLASATD